jgi:hypothetical protein
VCNIFDQIDLNNIDEQDTSKKMTGTQFLLVVLAIASLFVAYFYFDLGKDHNDNDDVVTLTVKASDTPEHIPNRKNVKRQYLLKAQEFNCHFMITDGAYDLIRDNSKLIERLETIKRGDDLKIVIYKSEEKDINNLYFKGTLAGLSTMDKSIFTPEEARQVDKINRKHNIWTASIIWTVILLVLVIVGLTKSSQ